MFFVLESRAVESDASLGAVRRRWRVIRSVGTFNNSIRHFSSSPADVGRPHRPWPTSAAPVCSLCARHAALDNEALESCCVSYPAVPDAAASSVLACLRAPVEDTARLDQIGVGCMAKAACGVAVYARAPQRLGPASAVAPRQACSISLLVLHVSIRESKRSPLNLPSACAAQCCSDDSSARYGRAISFRSSAPKSTIPV